MNTIHKVFSDHKDMFSLVDNPDGTQKLWGITR